MKVRNYLPEPAVTENIKIENQSLHWDISDEPGEQKALPLLPSKGN